MKIDIKTYVQEEKEKLKRICLGKDISLLILQVGNDSASNAYIRGKLQDAEEIGIKADLFKINSPKKILKVLDTFGESYDGIILQEPSGLSETMRKNVLNNIKITQDVDGFKKNSMFKPCTPVGIIGIIDHFYGEDLKGKHVVVIGRGELVGKPLVPLLIEKGATVTCCNSSTPVLSAHTQTADIVVSATGKPELVTRDMLKWGAFVIDAGISVDENGKLHGDCDRALYDDEEIKVTTVPGGVGLTTRLQLMKNVIEAGKMRY